MPRDDRSRSGVSASLLRGQRHLSFDVSFAVPASGVGVRMKGGMNVKALGLRPALPCALASDHVRSSHPQAGLAGTSRLLPSGNRTVHGKRPAQVPGSLTCSFTSGL